MRGHAVATIQEHIVKLDERLKGTQNSCIQLRERPEDLRSLSTSAMKALLDSPIEELKKTITQLEALKKEGGEFEKRKSKEKLRALVESQKRELETLQTAFGLTTEEIS